MRKQSNEVFNEYVSGAGPFYTSQKHNDMLGKDDQLSIQAVVDDVDIAGTVTVQIQHSADGRNFVNKATAAEINAATLQTNKANTATGQDNGASPSLAFVRLAVSLATTTRAHVKLHVTTRDQGAQVSIKGEKRSGLRGSAVALGGDGME